MHHILLLVLYLIEVGPDIFFKFQSNPIRYKTNNCQKTKLPIFLWSQTLNDLNLNILCPNGQTAEKMWSGQNQGPVVLRLVNNSIVCIGHIFWVTPKRQKGRNNVGCCAQRLSRQTPALHTGWDSFNFLVGAILINNFTPLIEWSYISPVHQHALFCRHRRSDRPKPREVVFIGVGSQHFEVGLNAQLYLCKLVRTKCQIIVYSFNYQSKLAPTSVYFSGNFWSHTNRLKYKQNFSNIDGTVIFIQIQTKPCFWEDPVLQLFYDFTMWELF